MKYYIRDFTDYIRALVLNRAIKLIKQGKVKNVGDSFKRDDHHFHYHVENERGGYYHVELDISDTHEVLEAVCDCPYTGVGLCKHTGAAMLDLLMEHGFSVEDLEEHEFHYDDAEVVDIREPITLYTELIHEMFDEENFNPIDFLAHQDKSELINFLARYIVEVEDIQLMVMSYLWYKQKKELEQGAKPKPPYLS